MKFGMKALVAAIALVSASGANAALQHGGTFLIDGDGTGEFFLSVVARDGLNEKTSYVRDLNITANDWNDGVFNPVNGQVVAAADTTFSTWLAQAVANNWAVKFSVAANSTGINGNSDTVNYSDNGIFTTSQKDLVNTLDPAFGNIINDFAGINGNLGGQYTAINLSSGGLDSFATAVGSQKLHDSATWGQDGAGEPFSAYVGNVEAGLNAASDFYFVNYFYNEANVGNENAAFGSLLGSWTLESDGDLVWNEASQVPQVPLPPALWLLGSALIGLAGISRRRQAVVAA